MSDFLMKVLWFRVKDKYKNPTNISGMFTSNLGKGLDIKNNIFSFSVKNAHGNYVSSDNEIKFEEQDQLKVFLKYTDDGADIESDEWSLETNTQPSTDYLAGVYYVIDFSVSHTGKDTPIKVACADKTYVLFNKVLAKSFGKNADGLSAPQIIQKIVRFASQTTKQPDSDEPVFIGTGSDSGSYYSVDARLSDGGEGDNAFITSTRRSITEGGNVNSDGNFPEIDFAMVWKPIYEWIAELSQIEKTNTSTELSTDVVYGRPFIFWVDELNRFHWIYPDDNVADYLEVGTAEGATLSYDSSQTNDATIHSVQVTKKVFDVTNMLIYNCGSDMYGTGIWDYQVNTASRVKTLKMRVVPMTDIAEDLKNRDYDTVQGTAASNREGTPAGSPKYQFPADARYPLSDTDGDRCVFIPTTTYANYSDITSDSDYNDALTEKALEVGGIRANKILSGLAHARWKGDIVTRGKIFTPGNLIEVTDTSIGLYRQKLRVMDIKHNISTRGWFTTISVEEDQEAVEAS